jgi:hypothetical protein
MSVDRRHHPSAPSHRSQNAVKTPQKTDPDTRAFRVQPNAAPLKPSILDESTAEPLRFPRSTERGPIEAMAT